MKMTFPVFFLLLWSGLSFAVGPAPVAKPTSPVAPAAGAPALKPAMPAAAPLANNNSEKAAQELNKELDGIHQQAQQVLNQVEKLAPPAPALPPHDAPPLIPGAPVLPENLEGMRQKLMTLAQDERFLKAVKDLWDHPDRNKLLAIQAAFFLFMIILKAFVQAKTVHWFKRLFLGFLFFVLTWAGILYVIPLVLLGEPFGIFTGTLWRVLVMGG
ncbi:MAG TPA: hypothetical protein VIH99_14070 [Bdellovibrionota bacterium]|jgi:hypothetical protein